MEQLKTEKKNVSLQRETIKAEREVDSLNYAFAKKKRSEKTLSEARKAQLDREKAKHKHIENQHFEKKYLEYDSISLPGFLFFEKNIIDIYGVCPFINITSYEPNSTDSKDIIKQQISKNRINWLNKQKDKGKLYYDLYDRIINEKRIKEMISKKNELESDIEELIKNNINELQYDMYINTIDYIIEYSNCKVKTKRIREKYKLLIYNLSVIFKETKLAIHNYLGSRYHIDIIINDLENKKKENEIIDIYMLNTFKIKLEEYKVLIEDLSQEEKYIKNSKNNLKYDLINGVINYNDTHKENILQCGKYFKRWIKLTKLEKNERFESYIEYHIKNNMISTNLIQPEEYQVVKDKLMKLVIDALDSKEMVYRDYTWDTKEGKITNIKILKYDQDKKDFYLKFTKQGTTNPKNVAIHTIFNIKNEQKIHDILLSTILRYFNKGDTENGTEFETNDSDTETNCETTENETENEKRLKQKCFDKVKRKLKIKKLVKNDKKKLEEVYTEFFQTVSTNFKSNN